MSPKKPFKQPPKRFQPKGLTILHEDHDIVVVEKKAGLLTVSSDQVKENSAYYLLTDYVRKGNPKSRNRVFIVHRLDRDTSGVIVFAKTEQAKRYLQDEWEHFKKTYIAIVLGRPPEQEGTIESYLAENQAHFMHSVSDPKKGKLSTTRYKVINQSATHSLLEIDLVTGRKNQIRVHFAEADCPVAGDKKYGEGRKGVNRLTLHAAKLSIRHPHSKEEMTFETKMPVYFKIFMKNG